MLRRRDEAWPQGLSHSEAKDYQKKFRYRCERVADILNRPAFCYLRYHDLCPWPPHCGLWVGQHKWRNMFCNWRDFGFALAGENGFEDTHGLE